jgi:N-formylmaleamate deformylase
MVPSWTSGICAANGIQIHYLRTGGPKPPLILLHGLTGNGACWSPLARALENEYDVVMPDARGHGETSTPLTGYCYEDFASDVIGLIKGLGLAAPVMLGHSMGGMTAALVAAQSGRSIRGLILADPTFLDPHRQREVYESDIAQEHRRFLCLAKDEALAEVRARYTRRDPELIDLTAAARMETRVAAFEVLAPPSPEYRKLIGAIRCPILLVVPQKGVVGMEAAQELQKLNPSLHVEQILGAGHGLQYDQPTRFEASVASFLQSLARER